MHVTRRQATFGGLSLLASTAMSTTSLAHIGDFLGIGEGLSRFHGKSGVGMGFAMITVLA